MRATPQVDEHIVRIERPVLAVEVVGIQPDQLAAGRDEPRPAALGAGPVVVVPGYDRHPRLGDVQLQSELGGDAAQFSRLFHDDYAKYARLVKDLKIKID